MRNFFVLLFGGLFFAFPVCAQTPPLPRPPLPPKEYKIETDATTEKSIAVDARVNVSLCVADGNLKITGWERNEIRVFISDGGAAGFKILQKNKANDNPVWVMVQGFDTKQKRRANADECLSGDDIEIEVPRGATVNVKGRASETVIDSIGKVSIENVGGDIFLSNIERGIEAKTYEGDVTVEKSGGAMSLFSTTGNIVAFDVAPSEIGDIFKAKTSNGAITLQQIEHRQIEAGSNSGSIKYTGAFQSGGQYSFGTANGTILLAMPEKSSCRINASYGFGAFNSEIPLQNVVKDTTSKTQSLTATLGGGEANIALTTYSGAIQIKKQAIN